MHLSLACRRSSSSDIDKDCQVLRPSSGLGAAARHIPDRGDLIMRWPVAKLEVTENTARGITWPLCRRRTTLDFLSVIIVHLWTTQGCWPKSRWVAIGHWFSIGCRCNAWVVIVVLGVGWGVELDAWCGVTSRVTKPGNHTCEFEKHPEHLMHRVRFCIGNVGWEKIQDG